MSSDVDINAVCRSWRQGVKKKFRGIASFQERAQKRFDLIEAHLFSQRVALNDWQIQYVDYREWGDYAVVRDWEPIAVGEDWGHHGPSANFRCAFTMPEGFAGEKVMLRFYVGGDTLLRVNGAPWHGVDPFRHNLFLTDRAQAGADYELVAETYAHYHAPRPDHRQSFALAELACVDTAIWDAYWDLWCVAKLLVVPELDSRLNEYVEYHLWEALKLIPVQPADTAELRETVLAAQRAIRETVYASDRFLGAGKMHFVGHSHLDVVFMWQHREYLRKVGRTHATMLRFMEQYPEFKFSQSQAKLYSDMKRCFPEIYEQVKARVAEGRWEPIGAFWVEPDCNLVSGESFVRQILHGQRFFEREFGLRSRTCWQPDVFGVSWGLPQILAKSGIEYFLTAKMVAWNDTNPWDKNTFWWEGLDGSRVLGIVPPGHFIGTVDPDMMDKQWRNFSDKNTVGETLHVYGWGDGGGGVDIEMIESARRYRDFPGLVPTEFSTAEEAFDAIRRRVDALREDQVPVHRDELYLEAHRGSVTTKGRLKKLNRQGELTLRDTELLSAFAWLAGADYPEDELDRAWKILLDGQFHDAVPGTHIRPVYHDLLAAYGELAGTTDALQQRAALRLSGVSEGAGALLLFNSAHHQRDEVIALDAELVGEAVVADAQGAVLPQQPATAGDGRSLRLVRPGPIPGTGFASLTFVPTGEVPAQPEQVRGSDRELENAHLRARFDDNGELVSLYDKDLAREVIVPGQVGNRFELYEDMPGKYDAWDIVETYKDHPIELGGTVSLEQGEAGPLRASLVLTRRFQRSAIVQRISLDADARCLVFATELDWRERQRLLKVAFPVDVNAESATYDIAFGNIARSNRANNPSQRAQFEVNAHQWMDLSQHDYGVSLLNDGKYGCDVADRRMRLTLLKGSVHPDPEADVEVHHFSYALYPHAGGWREAGTIERALELNLPMRRWSLESPAPAPDRLLTLEGEGVTLEAVKRSDDGRDLIVRLVERFNARRPVTLTCPRPLRAAWRCDIMEEQPQELEPADDALTVELEPYEIVTLRLRF